MKLYDEIKKWKGEESTKKYIKWIKAMNKNSKKGNKKQRIMSVRNE